MATADDEGPETVVTPPRRMDAQEYATSIRVGLTPGLPDPETRQHIQKLVTTEEWAAFLKRTQQFMGGN